MENARPAQALRLRSPAKINLTLSVLGRRDDGFHDIRSLMLGIDLCDELTLREESPARLTLVCNDPALPCDGRNLIMQAATRLRQAASVERGAAMDVAKRIPTGSGLGGGSSDAATALMGLNRLWGLGWSRSDLARLGAALGSDIPFFFALPSAAASGRGEHVEPVRLKWRGWCLLVFADAPVSTAEVYAAHDAHRPPARERPDRADVLAADTAVVLSSLLHNDLEPAVFRVAPAVRRLFEFVGKAAGRSPRVSGAGRTVYMLFDDKRQAQATLDRLRSVGIKQRAIVAATLNHVGTT